MSKFLEDGVPRNYYKYEKPQYTETHKQYHNLLTVKRAAKKCTVINR